MRQKGTLGWLKHDITNRGVTAWLLTIFLLAFYLFLYYGGRQFGSFYVPDVFTAVANLLFLPDKWKLYGLIYTLAVTFGGIHVIRKYRHNNYQIIRTLVVIFVQATFAFSIPWILTLFEQPEYYFSYLWPLEISYFYPQNILYMPLPFILYSLLGALLMVPVLGFFFGKRWYCSWVCGCGGLANTAGEPFRHLTSKSSAAWKFEKWAIHITLGFALFTTALVVASYGVTSYGQGDYAKFAETAASVQSLYGFIVVTMLSGIIGVVLYPIGGTRTWCRNFCPMAAMLGLIQKFGRFRIRVKKDMCISCGLCTKYCEMGIDVRAYAQKNQDFTRASCVGCGICAEVCPRGVLRLENVWRKDPQELTMQGLLDQTYKA